MLLELKTQLSWTKTTAWQNNNPTQPMYDRYIFNYGINADELDAIFVHRYSYFINYFGWNQPYWVCYLNNFRDFSCLFRTLENTQPVNWLGIGPNEVCNTRNVFNYPNLVLRK